MSEVKTCEGLSGGNLVRNDTPSLTPPLHHQKTCNNVLAFQLASYILQFVCHSSMSFLRKTVAKVEEGDSRGLFFLGFSCTTSSRSVFILLGAFSFNIHALFSSSSSMSGYTYLLVAVNLSLLHASTVFFLG